MAVATPALLVSTRTREIEPEALALPAAPSGAGYAPFRRPEETVLYRVVQEHLATFLAGAEEGGSLPRFVKREFASFLECGILVHGIVLYGRCGPPHADAVCAVESPGGAGPRG